MSAHIEIPNEIYAKLKENILEAWRAVQELARDPTVLRTPALQRASAAIGDATLTLTMAEIVVDHPNAMRSDVELRRLAEQRESVRRGMQH